MEQSFNSVFTALGSDTRLKMLKLLAEKEMHISELARVLEISVPVAAKHVKVLEKAELVERKIFGKSHVLSPNKSRILTAVDCFAPTKKIEVEKGATLLDALTNVASVEVKQKGEREMIVSTDGDEGFYLYEINGQLGNTAVRKYKLEDDITVEWKKLEPITKIKLDIHVKK
ncbi:DNA-binding transcriptional ArsR family regulator [Methanohalophilus levihalophilus]|uniref:ArsR family transcriptional regulator n=1 Tax=Methanohalophilus levihalophilus TaxID=1431282 RepID=UPI001AE405C8|nr:ArsR family transcriptional regulator [Methanohalophilus levihalophilus]MBP2030929.1 DNA-binding transcriptional ArsR family regulator [Methanohalophilus levihalophilus]